jgi:hypothetical protein
VVHTVTTGKRAEHRPAMLNVAKMVHNLGIMILNNFVAVSFVLRIVSILRLFNGTLQPEKLYMFVFGTTFPLSLTLALDEGG